ncbi:MAG: hypothetical protein QGH20_11245, partial [Candidatus Latescibacteria bacterium]|nr:hypothetical protein [Candidatus Latescibacterota bacterium]
MKVPWLTCASAATLCFQVVADAAFEAHATDPVSSTLAGSYSANCAPVYASRWNPARLVGNAPPVVSASHTSFFGLSELG